MSVVELRPSQVEQRRWVARIYYRVTGHLISVREYQIEELGEIDDLVESGPHWDAIAEVRIQRNSLDRCAEITLEEAREL